MKDERPEVQERRFMLLRIRDDVLLTILKGMFDQLPEYLVLPEIKNLPKDVIILRVQYLYEYMAFGFLIAHKTFTSLTQGCAIPHIDGEIEERVIKIEQANQQVKNIKPPEFDEIK